MKTPFPMAVAALLFSAWIPSVASAAEQPSQAGSAGQIMRDDIRTVCADHDQNRDGKLSQAELKDLNLDEKTFKVVDADQDGYLDMKECAEGLGSRGAGCGGPHRAGRASSEPPPRIEDAHGTGVVVGEAMTSSGGATDQTMEKRQLRPE